MGEFSDALLGGGQPQAPEPSFSDALLGDGTSLTANRSGQPSRSRVLDDPQFAAPNLSLARASLAPDAKDQIKRLSASMNVPESYFGVLNGEIVRWVPEENAYAKVAPTMEGASGFLEKASRLLGPQSASSLGPALPGLAATVAGTMAGPTGASIPIAGAAAGATDLLRQGADRALAGENPLNVDPLNSLGHAALGMVGQSIGVGANRLLTRNPLGVAQYDRLNAMAPAKQAERASLQSEAQRRGVQLSTGQSSGLSSVQASERQLSRFPETADQVADFTNRQRTEQVPQAFRNEMDQIAPATGREAQIGAFREGAENVVQGALNQRNAQAKIAYGQALDGRGRFWNEDVEQLMNRPSMQVAIAHARKIANEEGKDITVPVYENGKVVGREVVPDWRSWDYIKQGIDRVIEENTNEFGKVNAYGRAVVKTKQALLGDLDKANPDYAIARGLYGSDSEAVNSVLEGGVGLLQKMKGLDRQQIVERVFSGANILPEDISRMRGQFAMAGKLNDWNAGLRAYMDGALDKALSANVTGGLPGNVPGKLYADLWGDPRQKAVITAALGDKGRVESLNNLMKVLQASSRVLPQGSQTTTDLGAQQLGRTVAGNALRIATSPGKLMNIGSEIADTVNILREPAARQKLADYLLSDAGSKELQKFRMLSPGTQRSMTALIDLATNAGVLQGLNATGLRQPADFPAPAAAMTQGQPRP